MYHIKMEKDQRESYKRYFSCLLRRITMWKNPPSEAGNNDLLILNWFTRNYNVPHWNLIFILFLLIIKL